MSKPKIIESPLILLDDNFLEFFKNNKKSNLTLTLQSFFKQKKDNSKCKKYKRRFKTESSSGDLNQFFINGITYNIEHEFQTEDHKPREERYPSGGFGSVKTLTPIDSNKLTLKIKLFNADKNKTLCTYVKFLKKIIFEANVHQKLNRRAYLYMRSVKNRPSPFKFYLVMENLGQKDLYYNITEYPLYYILLETLNRRVKLATNILEQIQTLLDLHLLWIDGKIDNVIIEIDKDHNPIRASITDFDSIIDEQNLSSWPAVNTYIPHVILQQYWKQSMTQSSISKGGSWGVYIGICNYIRGSIKSPIKKLKQDARSEGFYDRYFMISLTSYIISALFPDVIQQKTEDLPQWESIGCVFPPKMLENVLLTKQQVNIFCIIEDMYKTGSSWEKYTKNSTANLREYICRFKNVFPNSGESKCDQNQNNSNLELWRNNSLNNNESKSNTGNIVHSPNNKYISNSVLNTNVIEEIKSKSTLEVLRNNSLNNNENKSNTGNIVDSPNKHISNSVYRLDLRYLKFAAFYGLLLMIGGGVTILESKRFHPINLMACIGAFLFAVGLIMLIRSARQCCILQDQNHEIVNNATRS